MSRELGWSDLVADTRGIMLVITTARPCAQAGLRESRIGRGIQTLGEAEG